MKLIVTVLIGIYFLLGFSVNAFAFNNKKPLHGQWGGSGISLFFTPNGADGIFYCSAGRIDSPVILDDAGNFCVTGAIDLYGGGTQAPKHSPATFSGHMDHKHMHLTVHMPGEKDWIFDADKDSQGQPYVCE